MNTESHSQLAAFIWSVADLLRGDFKQSQYGRIILPFTLLRRLECVLEPTKAKVLDAAHAHQAKPEAVREKLLLRAADHAKLAAKLAGPDEIGVAADTSDENFEIVHPRTPVRRLRELRSRPSAAGTTDTSSGAAPRPAR